MQKQQLEQSHQQQQANNPATTTTTNTQVSEDGRYYTCARSKTFLTHKKNRSVSAIMGVEVGSGRRFYLTGVNEIPSWSAVCVILCTSHVCFYYQIEVNWRLVKLKQPEFCQYGNHLQLKVSSPILRKWDTSPFPRAVLMPLAQFLFGSRSAERSSFSSFIHYRRAVKSLARTHMFSLWFPSRHSCPRRWTRPAPSLLLRHSSPRTSCWPSSPKRSWCWQVESTGSWQVQVSVT